jgi:hypothetical protein
MKLSAWDIEVEHLTEPYREGRAREHVRRAKHLRDETRREREMQLEADAEIARRAGVPFVPVPYSAAVENAGKWHMQRARGQRHRFERVAECQETETVEVFCRSCSTKAGSRAARCRTALVCLSCRRKIAREKLAKTVLARRAAIDLVAKRGLFRSNRKGGRWSEKLVTLTIQALPELGVSERIAYARAAWAQFVRLWSKWLREHPDGQHRDAQNHRLSRWLRHTEWTPGQDDRGHPHFHFWFLGPYIENRIGGRQDVSEMWWRALREAAIGLPAVMRALASRRGWTEGPELGAVEIRACRLTPRLGVRVERALRRALAMGGVAKPHCMIQAVKGKGALAEVIKYLFKDIVDAKQLSIANVDASRLTGSRLPPGLWAEVYASFDGTRTTQGSIGLMSLAHRLKTHEHGTCGRACDECGTVGDWRVVRRPFTMQEREDIERDREARRLSRRARVSPAQLALPRPLPARVA